MNLDAWEPPDPPDVADAVIARMTASTPHADEAPRRRYLWALLALPAAAAIIIVVATRGTDETDGAINADRARHVELDGASADLEPNTTIRWHRDRDGLRVEQTGTATWKTTDHLRLTAGATSIDATAANLRVEIKMNRQDAAIVTTSAITAAAVALVTVTVYNGAVRANNVAVPVGATVVIPSTDRTAPRIEPDCDAAALEARGQKLMHDGAYEAGEKAFLEAMECKPDAAHMLGAYEAACKLKDSAHAQQWFARLPQSDQEDGSTLQICLNNGIDPRPEALDGCNEHDLAELKRRGEEAIANGSYAEAQKAFVVVYDCRPESKIALRAYLAACKAVDAHQAKAWFKRMPQQNREDVSVLQICLDQGIDPRTAK